MRMRGIQCYILAPIKGHEFKRACHRIGGQYIKIAPGSPHCINVMEIRHTITPEMELIDEMDYSEMDSMLARKIQQLMIFFSLLIPDMTNEEEQMLDEALIKTYADFGITHDIVNNSKNKIILNLEPDEARYVQDVLKLTKTEVRSITRFERGEALVYSNNNKVPVVIKASKEEQEMITTDRAELEAILRERQKEKTHSA